MRKILAMTTAGVLAVGVCACFVGCGDKIGRSANDAEKIVSEEVTAEEWELAFSEESFDNCKLVMNYQQIDGEYIYHEDMTIIEVNGKGYCVEKYHDSNNSGNSLDERYYTIVGKYEGEAVSYSRHDGAVEWSVGSSGRSGSMVLDVLKDWCGGYESFIYSSEAKGYQNKQVRENTIIVKFKNKKVSAVHVYASGGGVKLDATFMLTYGNQSVIFPTVE